MSFAPRPTNTPNYQRSRLGSNQPASSWFRGQARSNPSSNPHGSNFSNGSYAPNAGHGKLGNNNVADFTALRHRSGTTKRQQQVSPGRTPLPFTKFSRQPLDFSPTLPKTTLTSPAPTFVLPNPWWLRSLFFLKYGSGLVAGGLILATLTIYGTNVSTQRQWSENYRQLENLRRTERQLVVANEVIKNQAAQQSSTTKELVRVDPARRIYLPTPSPQPQTSPKVMVMSPSRGTPASPPESAPSKNYPNLPLGY